LTIFLKGEMFERFGSKGEYQLNLFYLATPVPFGTLVFGDLVKSRLLKFKDLELIHCNALMDGFKELSGGDMELQRMRLVVRHVGLKSINDVVGRFRDCQMMRVLEI